MLGDVRLLSVGPRRRVLFRAAAVTLAISTSTLSAGLTAATATATAGAPHAREARVGAAARRPKPEVVTSVYALTQLVSYIAGNAVRVVDIAPPGAQPQGVALTAAGRGAVERAALVIDVGDGYQPQVEAAARLARRHLDVLPAVSKQAKPYEFWLDPYLMAKAAVVIATSLTAADPAGRTDFQNGSRNFQSVASSIESDLDSTFTSCERSEFVTSDAAFQRFASSFDLVDLAVDAAGVKKATALVRQNSLPAVFSEVGVPSTQVQEVARATGASVQSLNPMEVAPYPGAPAPLSYFAATEYNVTTLEGPLACDTTSI